MTYAYPRILYQPNFMLAIQAGMLNNAFIVHKFGSNLAISTGTPEDICIQGGDYNFLSTAQTIFLSSTLAGDAGKKITVEGLDTNWEMISEEITLDGTAPQTTAKESTKSFIRINRFYNSDDAGNEYAGDIYIGSTSSISAGVPSTLTLGKIKFNAGIEIGQSQQSIYSIPANHTGFLIDWKKNVAKGDDSDVYLQVREFGKVFRVHEHVDVFQSTDNEKFHYKIIPSKSDIKMRASTSGSGIEVSVIYTLMLLHNRYLNL